MKKSIITTAVFAALSFLTSCTEGAKEATTVTAPTATVTTKDTAKVDTAKIVTKVDTTKKVK